MEIVNVNYWAILVSGILYSLLGGLWYSPILFAKPWMKALGLTDADLPKMQANAGPAYAVSIVGAFVTAFILSIFVTLAGATSVQAGLTVGFMIWLGFVATTVAPPYFYEDRPKLVYLIYAGYTLTAFLIMSSILAIWR